MRAPSRLTIALAALAVALTPALGALTTAPAAAAEIRSGGLEGYSACLADAKEGDLLLLVDESGSLEDNDPDDARVEASTYLLEQLARTTADGEVVVDVSVARFSSDVTTELDWTPLDATGLDEARTAVDRLRDRDRGLETDYWTAMEAGRQSLADHLAAEGGESRCQAIAWFSDGDLDLEPRSAGATKPYAPDVDLTTEQGATDAEALAQDSLCRPGGLADQVRASGIWTLGIGLAAGTSAGQDFSLMRSIATGTDPAGATCGALVDPVPGDFSLAADIDELLFAFDRIAAGGASGPDVTAGVCQGAVCTDQAHRFVLDASIGTVHVLAYSDVPDVEVVLVAPDGTQQRLERAAGAQTGGAATWQWLSDRTVTIDLTRPDAAGAAGDGWSGQWSLVFVDETANSPDGRSRSNIRIEGDLLPTLTSPDGVLHVGEAVGGFRLGLETRTGEPVDPASLLGTVSLSAVLVAPDGQERPIGDGLAADRVLDDVVLDLAGIPPGEALVRLTLGVTTAPAPLPDGSTAPGTALATQRVDVPLSLAPPLNFPDVAASRVDFGRTEGAADLSAVLPVTGPGCVWLPAEGVVPLASPAEAGEVTVGAGDRTGPDTCLEIEEGRTVDLPLTLVTEAAGNGSVNGILTLSLAPVGEPDRATTIEVPYTADLRKPLNPVTALGAFLAALVLGPGLPLGLLYLLKHRGARIPPRGLSGRTIPVTVADSQLLRDGAPFALRDDDFVQLVPLGARGARTVAVDGVTLRTRVGWSPFGPGSVLVEAPGRVGASSTTPTPVGKEQQAELPLAVHNTWAVLVDPAAPDERAEVLVLVGADAPPHRRTEVADDVAHRAPALIRSLRDLRDLRDRADGSGGTGGAGSPTGTNRTGGVSARTATASRGPEGEVPAPSPFGPAGGASPARGADPARTGHGQAPARNPFDFSLDDEDGSR